MNRKPSTGKYDKAFYDRAATPKLVTWAAYAVVVRMVALDSLPTEATLHQALVDLNLRHALPSDSLEHNAASQLVQDVARCQPVVRNDRLCCTGNDNIHVVLFRHRLLAMPFNPTHWQREGAAQLLRRLDDSVATLPDELRLRSERREAVFSLMAASLCMMNADSSCLGWYKRGEFRDSATLTLAQLAGLHDPCERTPTRRFWRTWNACLSNGWIRAARLGRKEISRKLVNPDFFVQAGALTLGDMAEFRHAAADSMAKRLGSIRPVVRAQQLLNTLKRSMRRKVETEAERLAHNIARTTSITADQALSWSIVHCIQRSYRPPVRPYATP